MQIESFITSLNRVIMEATDHGGDYGGPYFTNRRCLYDEIEILLHNLELYGYKPIDREGYIIIGKVI